MINLKLRDWVNDYLIEHEADFPFLPDEDDLEGFDHCVADLYAELDAAIADRIIEWKETRMACSHEIEVAG